LVPSIAEVFQILIKANSWTPWMGDQNIGGVTLTEDDRAKKSAGFNGIQTHDLRI